MPELGKSIALNATMGIGSELTTRVEEALKTLARLGYEDASQESGFTIKAGSGRLGPVDAVASSWSEMRDPQMHGGSLPFRHWQCESLLNQALDLMDRCLAERTRYDALRDRYIALWLEVQGFLLEDNAYLAAANAIWAGRAAIADSETNRANSEKDVHTTLANDIRVFLAQPRWNPDTQGGHQAQTARAAVWSPYRKVHDQSHAGGGYTNLNTDPQPAADNAQGVIAIPDYIAQQTLAATVAAVGREQDNLNLQLHAAVKGEEVAAAAVVTASNGAAQVSNERALEEGLQSAHRKRIYLQAVAMTAPGGALNFLEQMEPVRHRFLRDLADAYARLAKAEQGLQEVYGYTLPLPALGDAQAAGLSLLDLAVAWARSATGFIVRFAQRDQVVPHSISVRRLLLDGGWEQQNGGADPRGDGIARFEFRFPDDLFAEIFYPRIRGLSVFLVLKEGQPMPRGIFRGRIRPPEIGRTSFFEEDVSWIRLEMAPADQDGVRIPANISAPRAQSGGFTPRSGTSLINQADAPWVRIGRIAPRESLAGADRVGVVALSNLSPFSDSSVDRTNGVWVLEVDRRSTQGEELGKVAEDLELEVGLAYQGRWR